MKRKWISRTAILLLFASIIVIVLWNSEKADIVKSDVRDGTFAVADDARIMYVPSEGSYIHIYSDAQDLTSNSYNVIVGEIIGIEYIDERAIARTICTVKVHEVIAGEEITADTEIKILEYQGYCRLSRFVEVFGNDHFKDYDLSSADTEYFAYTAEGEPFVSVGEQYVYFLSPKLSSEEVDGEYFEIMGTFMGKYRIENDMCARYKPTEDFYDTWTNGRIVKREGSLELNQLKNIVIETWEEN